jgi:hypothetical protein
MICPEQRTKRLLGIRRERRPIDATQGARTRVKSETRETPKRREREERKQRRQKSRSKMKIQKYKGRKRTFHCAGKLPNRVGTPMRKASYVARMAGVISGWSVWRRVSAPQWRGYRRGERTHPTWPARTSCRAPLWGGFRELWRCCHDPQVGIERTTHWYKSALPPASSMPFFTASVTAQKLGSTRKKKE